MRSVLERLWQRVLYIRDPQVSSNHNNIAWYGLHLAKKLHESFETLIFDRRQKIDPCLISDVAFLYGVLSYYYVSNYAGDGCHCTDCGSHAADTSSNLSAYTSSSGKYLWFALEYRTRSSSDKTAKISDSSRVYNSAVFVTQLKQLP